MHNLREKACMEHQHPDGYLRPGGLHGGGVIVLLLFISIANAVDRQLPFILADAIKADLDLTDTQIGLMAGLAFALVYSMASLPLARLADRSSARGVLIASLAVWSLMTGLTGLIRSFPQLILCRIGVAASEAGSMPSAHALIGGTFPRRRRAVVLALFSLGVPVGSTIGLVLGGWIADAADWRRAFLFVGLPGLALAALSFATIPPSQQSHRHDHNAALSFVATVRHLLSFRSFRHMAAASSLFACGSYALNVFAPAFLMRIHGLTTAQAGAAVGLAFGLGGGLGTFIGGALADALGQRDHAWRLWIPAIGLLLSAPAALGTWLVDDPGLSIGLLTFTMFFGLLYFAPTFSAAQRLAPEGMHAMASAVLLFFLTLIGSSIGPMAVGKMSDLLAPHVGRLSLRYALCLMAITMIWSAWHFLIGARSLGSDLIRSEAMR